MAYRRKSKKVFRKRRAYVKPRGVAKKPMVKLVKQVVNRMAEKKIQTYNVLPQPFQLRTGSASIAQNVFPMTPEFGQWTIAQGSGQGNRIGNKVRTVSALLDVNMTMLPYNATTNPVPTPQYVRIWFVRYKPAPASAPPSASLFGATSAFFQVGSTNSGLTGTFSDMQYHINKDLFTLLGYRTYKIAPAIYEGTGSVATAGYYANNDFKLSVLKRINLTKMFPKVLNFNDSDSTITTAGVYMVIQLIASTGTAYSTTYQPLQMGFTLTYTYTDD